MWQRKRFKNNFININFCKKNSGRFYEFTVLLVCDKIKLKKTSTATMTILTYNNTSNNPTIQFSSRAPPRGCLPAAVK